MYHFDSYISSNICTDGFFREEIEGFISNKQEIISIFKYFNSITKFVESFSKAKRFGDIKRCCRLSLKSDNPWNYPNRRDCFNFPVDKDVALRAIIFSSLKTKIKLISDLKVRDNISKSALATETASFPSELLQCEKCSYHGFEVYFDQQINIKKNTSYAISDLISGPPTCQGISCVGSIQCAGLV